VLLCEVTRDGALIATPELWLLATRHANANTRLGFIETSRYIPRTHTGPEWLGSISQSATITVESTR
jgi:hypothetical protein